MTKEEILAWIMERYGGKTLTPGSIWSINQHARPHGWQVAEQSPDDIIAGKITLEPWPKP